MKKISNLSHAKAVHAVKSIGKVLLPVALLLAAILCIGVCAGAEDATYVSVSKTQHVKIVGTNSTTEDCSAVAPACASKWTCYCGNTVTKGATGEHTPAYVVSENYLKKAGSKCGNTATYVMSCADCGATCKDTFVPSTLGDNVLVTVYVNGKAKEVKAKTLGHSFTVKSTKDKYLVEAVTDCNTPKTYYYSCACGTSSKGNVYEATFTSTVTTGHTIVHYDGQPYTDSTVTSGKVKFSALKIDGQSYDVCTRAGVYYDYCSVCGTVVTSSTYTYAGSQDKHSFTTYKNDDAHWNACKYCGLVQEDSMAPHAKADEDKDRVPTSCQDPVTCSCGYVFASVAHDMIHVEAKDATCLLSGNKEYWVCKYEKTDDGTYETYYTKKDGSASDTLANLTIAAKGHTADASAPACLPGKCTVCGETLNGTVDHEYAETADNYDTYIDDDGKVQFGHDAEHQGKFLLCTAKCSVCGAQNKSSHNYRTVIYQQATCTAKGLRHDVCVDCGDVINERETAALGHLVTTGFVSCYTSATCEREGCTATFKNQHTLPASLKTAIENKTFSCTDSYKCTVCGAELVAKTHTPVAVNEAQAATCETAGKTAGWYCSCKVNINGVDYACNMKVGCVEIPATGHKWGEWKVTKEATCVAAGSKYRDCTADNCEVRDTVVIPQLDATKEASHKLVTASNSLRHWKECTVVGCNYTTDKADHTYDPAKTCVVNGVCSVCNYVDVCNGSHKFPTTPNAKDDNYHWTVCSECGEMKEGSKVAHSLDMLKPYTAPEKCVDGYTAHLECECGWTNESYTVVKATAAHTWSWMRSKKLASQKVDGTLSNTSNGSKGDSGRNAYAYRHCDVCGEFEAHKCELKAGSQTCTTDGVCKYCGQTMLTTKDKTSKAATGHKFGDFMVTDTLHSVSCKNRGLVVSDKHTVKAACADSKCTVCSALVKATKKHTPKTNDAGEPIYTIDGTYHSYECEACGQKIDKEKHYSKNLISYDCTVDITCDVCKKILSKGYEGHDFDMTAMVPAVEATCTTAGHSAGYKCTRCEYVLNDVVVEPLGHDWSVVAGKAPTETEDGYTEHKVCTVCGETEGKEVLPKTGSSVVKGDFNGDGKVTSDDAIALLKAILFGSDANQSKDYNADGKVDSADAIALLKAALFG